ncbi:MAG TPA: hypothetical protein VJA21_16175 [Verrucomicrobiae bacterium]
MTGAGAEADVIKVNVAGLNEHDKLLLCQRLLQDVRQHPSMENRLRVLLHLAAMGDPADPESEDLQQQVWLAANEGDPAAFVDAPGRA